MKRESDKQTADAAPAVYEPPLAVRLVNPTAGTGGGLPCGPAGSGAFGHCSTGFAAGVDCEAGSSADEYCEDGSNPTYQH